MHVHLLPVLQVFVAEDMSKANALMKLLMEKAWWVVIQLVIRGPGSGHRNLDAREHG